MIELKLNHNGISQLTGQTDHPGPKRIPKGGTRSRLVIDRNSSQIKKHQLFDQ